MHRSIRLSAFILILLAGGLLWPACSAQANDAEGEGTSTDSQEVMAKVNGQEITEAELLEEADQELQQAEAQLESCKAEYERNKFQILETNLKGAVDNRLIEAEAEKRGVSKEDLMAAEVDAMVQPVTDEDVDTWSEPGASAGALEGRGRSADPPVPVQRAAAGRLRRVRG